MWIVLVVILLIVLAMGKAGWSASPRVAAYVTEKYKDLALKYSRIYPDTPLPVALAIISYESLGDPTFTNDERHKAEGIDYDDSVGLGGISDLALQDFNAATGKGYRLDEMLDPEKNIEVIFWNVSRWRRFYKGSLDLAIRQHNGNVKSPVTAVYLERIRQYEQLISKLL